MGTKWGKSKFAFDGLKPCIETLHIMHINGGERTTSITKIANLSYAKRTK